MTLKQPQTPRELLAMLAAFPRSRRIVAYATIPGFVIFLIALVVAYYYQAGFVTGLVLAFLMLLCLTHSNYAMNFKLTQKKVRRIDYWYLGAATIGLFLFTVGYSGQRDIVLTRMYTKVHQAGEAPVREKVESEIAGLSEFLCARLTKRATAACDGLKKVSAEIKPNLPVEKIKELQELFRKEVTLPYGRLFLIEQLEKDPSLFSPLSVVLVRIDHWREYMESAPKTGVSNRAPDEDFEIMFGLGQWVVWPFLLAYALALRITKVTIDVFEWTQVTIPAAASAASSPPPSSSA